MDVSNLTIKIQTSGLETAQQGLDKLGQKAHKAETSAQQLANSFKSLNTVIAGVASSLVVREFIKTADEMSLLNSRLKMTTSSMGEFIRQQQQMHKIARSTHSSIKDVTELYVKLSPALKNLGKSTEEVNQVTTNFTKALQLGGASAEESAAAIKQFAQAMGSGMLRGDEFNSMMEASPKLMAYMAKGMNVPIGKLRELGSQGKLTAEAVSNALLKMSKEIEEDFKNMPLTVGKATTDLRTELALLIDDFNKTTGATQSIANSIAFFADVMGENRQEIVTFAKHIGILTAATLTTVAAKKALPPVISAATTAYLQMTTNINGATFATRAFNSALAVTKTAFKTFLPTAAIFAGFELLSSLLGDNEEKADGLARALSRARDELKGLTVDELERDLIKLQKEQKETIKNIEYIEYGLSQVGEEIDDLSIKEDAFSVLNSSADKSREKLKQVEDQIQAINEQLGILKDTSNSQNHFKGVLTTLEELEKKYEKVETEFSLYNKLELLKKDLAELDKVSYLDAEKIKKQTATRAAILKEIEKTEDRISNLNKKETKDRSDYFNAIREMSRALMTDQEREIDLIKERTKSWIEAGANAKKAREIESELIKKVNQREIERVEKENADRLQREQEYLQEYYEMKGDYEKAWQIERLKIEEQYQAILEKEGKKAADDFLKFYKNNWLGKFKKETNKAFKDIKGSWADTVSTMQKTVEEGFFDFFMQKTKSLKGALKEIGQGVFRDFISPYARSLSQGLAGGFGALLGGGSNLASIASFYGLTKNSEGGFSGQVNGTDVVISGTGEILSGNSAFGGAGNILSAVSNLKSIYSMFSGGYSGLVSNFTTAPVGYLSSYLSSAGYTGASFGIQGLGVGAQHALTGNLIAGGGLNGTLSGAYGAGYIGGAALAGAGVGYGIGTLGDKLFKADTKAGTYGAIGGALGGAASAGLLGAQIGAFMGPFGMLIGAALGAIIGGMIGKWKTTDTGLFLDKGIAASLGQSTILSDVKRFEDQQKKTWFSKKDKTNFSDIDEETLKALNSAFAATKHVLKGISATDHLYLREGKFSGNDFFNQNLAGAAISAFTGQLGKDSTHKSFAALADKEKKEIYEVILGALGTIKQAVTEIDFIGIKNPIVSAAKVVENSIDTFKISTDNAFGEFSNILSISTDKFKEKYLNALRNDFTKENVDKWNAAKQAYEAARKAQEDYTKAVISFTQQIAGIQSGFYGANKIDTTFLGLQSIYRRFNTLLGGLNYDINDNQRKDVAKFGSATDIHSWSKYLLSLSSDQMQAFLSEGNTELRQELVKVLTEHKQAIDASGGEGWIKSLVELEALNKQIAGLKLAEQAEKTLQLQREQLNVLNLQKSAIEKLSGMAQRIRDSVIDHKTSGINYQFALERARVAWNNKDYSSKAFDNLSNAANHQQQYFKDTAKTYEEYKLNMLKMAGEIEAISDRTTLDDINKSIKKLEDLLNIGNKTIENQLTALELQRQQLIQNSKNEISELDRLLGNSSPMVRYLRDVLTSLMTAKTPGAKKPEIPDYSSGKSQVDNRITTANGALLLSELDKQINQTYLSSLGRSVEQSGLEFWRNKINAGQMSITQLAGELIKGAIAITGSNNKSDWIEWYKSKGFKPFADGGIVTRPTRALIGEAGYPEAVIPLRGGKGVKVDMDGGFELLSNTMNRLEQVSQKIEKNTKELVLFLRGVISEDGEKIQAKVLA